MAARGSLALRMRKASKITGCEEKPSYPLPVPDWGWDEGKAGTWATEVRTVSGGGVGWRKLSV